MVSDFRVESLVSMYASSRSRHVYSEYSVNGAPQSGNLQYSWFLSCLIKKSAFIDAKSINVKMIYGIVCAQWERKKML